MFDPVKGAQRSALPPEEAERLQRAGVLMVDQRRRRPLWFDGRFLAARDLEREQDYFLTRQADLADAVGFGVAAGLEVHAGRSATELRITPGHGVATGGVRVEVAPQDPAAGTDKDLVVDIADLAAQLALNEVLGLARKPTVPDRVRSGLYAIVLRPVEFTASPGSRYPTRPGEARSVHDTEIVEATLVSLIPFRDAGADRDDHQQRSQVARQLFLETSDWQPPTNCLPLALVRLERNQVRWLDTWLLRRPLGDARSDPLGLGTAPRPARVAFLRQYQSQLAAVLAERTESRLPLRFPATDHFVVLPAAGPMPVQAIADAGNALVQHWFPPDMDVDLALVPVDELAAVVEESMLLPPIALTGDAEELAATSVLVMVPVSRADLAGLATRPVVMTRPVVEPQTRGAGLPGLGIRHWSALADLGLRISKRTQIVSAWMLESNARVRGVPGASIGLGGGAAPAGTDPEVPLDRWRTFLARADVLWYVRRRSVSFKEAAVGLGREVITDEATAEERLRTWLGDVKLVRAYEEISGKATTPARARLFEVFSGFAKDDAQAVARASLEALRAGTEFHEAAVVATLAPFRDPRTREAVQRVTELVLESETDEQGQPVPARIEHNRKVVAKLADPTTLAHLREIVKRTTSKELDEAIGPLKDVLRGGSKATVAARVAKIATGLGGGEPR
jgi:hypothetical protein